jgi:hypothetical protein
VVFHALQQVVDFDVGVALLTVLHRGAFAEQRSASSKNRIALASLGGIEDRAQVLFGFADILADESGEVNTVKIEIQVAP